MLDTLVINKVVHQYYWESTDDVLVKKVTDTVLDQLLEACNMLKHMEERIEFYDDENDPDRNTWIEVDGEGYGWLWSQEEDDPGKWHGLLKNSLLEYIKQKRLMLNDEDEYVVIVNTDRGLVYHFIERESFNRDVIYTFSNEIIDY